MSRELPHIHLLLWLLSFALWLTQALLIDTIKRKTDLKVRGAAGRARFMYSKKGFIYFANASLPDTPILLSISEETRGGVQGAVTTNTSVITWFHSVYLNQNRFGSGSL